MIVVMHKLPQRVPLGPRFAQQPIAVVEIAVANRQVFARRCGDTLHSELLIRHAQRDDLAAGRIAPQKPPAIDQDTIRLISARLATRHERRRYEEDRQDR